MWVGYLDEVHYKSIHWQFTAFSAFKNIDPKLKKKTVCCEKGHFEQLLLSTFHSKEADRELLGCKKGTGYYSWKNKCDPVIKTKSPEN